MLKFATASVLVLSLAVLIVTGCSRRRTPSSRYRSEELSEEDQARKSEKLAGKMLAKLESLYASDPSDLESIQEMAYEIEARAPGTPAEKHARKILKAARRKFESKALKRLKKVLDQARDLVDAERYEKAQRTLERFLKEFGESEAAQEVRVELREVTKYTAAKHEYEVFVHNTDSFRSVSDYKGALEYVHARMPTSLKDTPYETALAEYLENLHKEAQGHGKQALLENALPWEDLPTGGGGSWSSDGGVWDVRNGVIRGTHDEEDMGRFMVGDDDWQDYVLNMTFNLKRGQFLLGLRGVRTVYGTRMYKTIGVCSGLTQAAGQVEMRVTVRGDMVAIQSASLPETRYIKITEPDGSFKHTHGPICIFLKSGSEMELSRLRVKHLTKVSSPTAEK